MTDSPKLNETADDLDLEDGEIESDNDEDVIQEDKNVTPPSNKATNMLKNPFAQIPKADATLSPVHKTRDGVKDKTVDG